MQKEIEKNEKVEAKTKKKHRFLKGILIIIGILVILFVINFIRNLIIINNIKEKQEEFKNISNYSCIIQNYSSKDVNDRNSLQYYHKDNKFILIRETENSKIIIWSDKNTKEVIFLNPKELTATVTTSEIDTFYDMKPVGITDDEKAIALFSIITSEKVNGVNCYKIDSIAMKRWISKENGITLKNASGKEVIDNKDYDYIAEWNNWKLNELKDEDMSRPNLTGYKVTKN